MSVVAISAVLIHLTAELRQVRQVIKAQNVQNVRATYAQHFAQVSQSLDLADILMRLTKNPESVDPDVKMRFYATLLFVFTAHESAYHMKIDGDLDLRDWHLFNRGMMDLMNLPGVQYFWQKRKHWYSDDFRGCIDNDVIPASKSISYEPIG